MPIRVQLSRKKGFRLPENTVSVVRPGPWGNPFIVGSAIAPDAATAVEKFDIWMTGCLASDHPAANHTRAALETLRGKNLACYCDLDSPCHADVLLKLANEELSHDR